MQVNEALEIVKRKNNVVIMGVNENDDNDLVRTHVENLFSHLLEGEKIRFEVCDGVGKKTDDKSRRVKDELRFLRWKIKVKY